MGAIEKMEDLVRRYSSRRDAQGNAHNLTEDIQHEFLLSFLAGVLREEIRTYCECRGHASARNVRQKGSSHPGGDDPMDIGAFGKGKGKQGNGKHGKGKGKGKQGQQGQHGQDKDKSQGQEQGFGRMLELWKKVDTTRKTVGARRTTKVVRKENTNPRMQMLTILTRNHQLLNQKLKLMNSA